MSRLVFLFGILVLLLFPLTAAAGLEEYISGTVPRAAQEIANQMDTQLMRRIGKAEGGRSSVMIVSTVPVSLNNLDESNPLSRQMSEEIMRALIEKGYRVNEIRKGKDIVMIPKKGEMILTRDLSDLATRDARSVAVLAGTYTITPDNVRFNMRLLHTPSNEVMAMGAGTVPVTDEIQPLLADKRTGPPQPSVFTRLP